MSDYVMVNSALVNAHHLGLLPDEELFVLARLVGDELERRDAEERKAPWPVGHGKLNPNATLPVKRIW